MQINKLSSKCPCCCSQYLSPVIDAYSINSSSWSSSSKSTVEFRHHPHFCETCGHIFNTKKPSNKQLIKYYNDQINHVAEDYDVQKRLNLIKSTTDSFYGKRLLDFGGNTKQSFHQKLEELSCEVEIADSSNDKIKAPFDLITSYFVFEHLVDLDNTLALFRDIIKKNGIIIIEVPDTNLYKNDYSGLMYEHQQHFQLSSLIALFLRFGFSFISSSQEDCSRNFGFVAVFKKTSTKILNEVDVNKDVVNFYKIARKQQIAQSEYPKKFFFRDDIFLNKKGIIFWGVNANLDEIINSVTLNLKHKIAIDLNADKQKYLDDDFEFFTPDIFFKGLNNILLCKQLVIDDLLFIITATEHYKAIKKEISLITNQYLLYDPIGRFK